jgi:murein DD-endopeptidase MepM/ murein hydrolase activator NlpD
MSRMREWNGVTRGWLRPVALVAGGMLPVGMALGWEPGLAAGGARDAVAVERVAAGGPAAWAFHAEEEGGEGEDEPRSTGAAVDAGPPLRLPVLGVERSELRDSWGDARGETRRHEGIDIFAPHGTPVIAAADGWVWALKWNDAGGRTLYVVEASGTRLLYYAHLDGYAQGMEAGRFVREGDVVGYVGRSGRVVGRAHLHFAVSRLRDPDRWWDARPVNPFPLLAR